MILTDLLKHGYFPKELPPCFNTKSFADNLVNILTDYSSVTKKIKESLWTTFSLPKIGFNRRMLGIPNPLHQCYLTNEIVNNWTEINNSYNKSNISFSKAKYDPEKIRGALPEHSFGEFKKRRIIDSFSNLYELKIDISRYYATIYTHIIPWILHTKRVAKAHRYPPALSALLLGNRLDKCLRETNMSQTLGIPIGPDTSLIISEIILCTIDELIQKQFPDINGFRFYDDYYFYCDDYSTAENILKFIQGIFTDYLFEINEEKTAITKFPFSFEAPWAIELSRFQFRATSLAQQTDIERFVSMCFNYAKIYPNDSVLTYAMKIIMNLNIDNEKENWEIYESLVLKIAIVEPVTLNLVTKIFAQNEERLNKVKIKKTIETIINEHLAKRHQYEVTWALWMCKEFDITLNWKFIELILQSEDVISIIISLDLLKSNLVDDYSDQSLEGIISSTLFDEKWILTYEAIMQGWVTPTVDPIDEDEFFKLLKKYKVSFYDSDEKFVNEYRYFDVPEPSTSYY